jgi:uncharacterized protein (DUF58 family)
VVLSDGFDQLRPLQLALRLLRHRHHEVLFFQVVAPEEEEFPFRRPARFRNLENLERWLRVDPQTLRAAYLENYRRHCEALRTACLEIGADYHKITTADSIERCLLDYLAARSQRGVIR